MPREICHRAGPVSYTLPLVLVAARGSNKLDTLSILLSHTTVFLMCTPNLSVLASGQSHRFELTHVFDKSRTSVVLFKGHNPAQIQHKTFAEFTQQQY